MGLLSFFHGTKRYEHEYYVIEDRWATLPNAIRSITSIIDSRFLDKIKNIGHVQFVLLGSSDFRKHADSKHAYGFFDPEEWKKGSVVIYFDSERINDYAFRHTLEENFTAILTHELAHVEHASHKSFHDSWDASRRMKAALDRKYRRHITASTDQLRLVRLFLSTFFDMVHMEGIAEYSSHAARSKISLDSTSQRKYRSAAKDIVEQIVMNYHTFIEFTKQNRKASQTQAYERLVAALKSHSRLIGMHMTQTIMLAEEISNIEVVMKRGHVRFVKDYEHACHAIKQRPLVSYTSGKGMLDYKKMTNEFMQAYNAVYPNK